jgi:hypothetical protein
MPESGMPDQIQPDLSEVQQEESDAPALMDHPVLVRQDGPVLVHDLPSRVGVMRSITLGTTPEQVLMPDRRRKAAVLLSLDQSIWLGNSSSEVSQGAAAKWPANLPIELRHCDRVFAAATTGTTTLTILVEDWAN